MTKKSIPGYGLKDENGIYVRQTPAKVEEPVLTTVKEPIASDISLDDLLSKQLLILYRETQRLLMESSSGILLEEHQRALVNYIKLTKELKKDENELLDKMSDEDLERLAKESERK